MKGFPPTDARKPKNPGNHDEEGLPGRMLRREPRHKDPEPGQNKTRLPAGCGLTKPSDRLKRIRRKSRDLRQSFAANQNRLRVDFLHRRLPTMHTDASSRPDCLTSTLSRRAKAGKWIVPGCRCEGDRQYKEAPPDGEAGGAVLGSGSRGEAIHVQNAGAAGRFHHRASAV